MNPAAQHGPRSSHGAPALPERTEGYVFMSPLGNVNLKALHATADAAGREADGLWAQGVDGDFASRMSWAEAGGVVVRVVVERVS